MTERKPAETRRLQRLRRGLEGELQQHYTREEAERSINAILAAHSSDCVVRFFEKELEIRNSCCVRSRRDRLKVSLIISRCGVTEREYDNLAAEWYLHNLAYDLRFLRAAARHAALDYAPDPRFIVKIVTRLMEMVGLV